MKYLFKDRYFTGYLVIYSVTLVMMSLIEHFPVSNALAVLLIIGVFFSLVAYYFSKSSVPLISLRPVQKRESLLLVVLLVYIVLILTIGFNKIKLLIPAGTNGSEKLSDLVLLFYKLTVFVLIPFLLYKFLYKFRLRDFGLVVKAKEFFTRKNIVIILAMALIIFCFQYFLGNGAAPIREGLITKKQLLIGLPLLYVFLIFNVGLVEEFFFRALLQSRISVITNSEIGGITISGLLFGLAHAPGFYLRGGGTLDNLGQHPSFFMSAGYSIVVLSVGGFFLSIIWSKTKNLWLVAAIHAFMDVLPGLKEFITTWGIR